MVKNFQRIAHDRTKRQVVSCYMSAERKKNDEDAEETAAAKETEEISKEDVEIRRLIEERRNTPKEEKQRLKEVNKHIENVSGTKE